MISQFVFVILLHMTWNARSSHEAPPPTHKSDRPFLPPGFSVRGPELLGRPNYWVRGGPDPGSPEYGGQSVIIPVVKVHLLCPESDWPRSQASYCFMHSRGVCDYCVKHTAHAEISRIRRKCQEKSENQKLN